MANKYAGTQTEKNLEAAFAGESMARNKYTYFASKAKKEGIEQISALFQKAGIVMWECRNCGHLVVSADAPKLCPVCKHPQAYFEVHKENY